MPRSAPSIGVFGVFDRHPVLYFPMPWYVRAPIIGAWVNFVLMLFTYDTMKTGLAAACRRRSGL
jgi:hypothetical protein